MPGVFLMLTTTDTIGWPWGSRCSFRRMDGREQKGNGSIQRWHDPCYISSVLVMQMNRKAICESHLRGEARAFETMNLITMFWLGCQEEGLAMPAIHRVGARSPFSKMVEKRRR